jgi:hypothetical protein
MNLFLTVSMNFPTYMLDYLEAKRFNGETASFLVGVTQTMQMTVHAGCRSGACIPGASIFVGVAQTVYLSSGSKPSACDFIPSAAMRAHGSQ